jgi:hypothetical protein
MWPWIVIGIVLVLVVGGLVAMIVITNPIAQSVYEDQLVKTSPDKWLRVCSDLENEEQVTMWNVGCAWAEDRKAHMQEVEIEHDGLHLYGEYYQFGGERCVIILPGRCECLKYSYFFAAPYEQAGMNVLVIDQRAHGKSDGKYNTIGVKEHRDVIAWIHFLEKTYRIREVWLHGICIGSSSAILTMTSAECPAVVKGMVTEGCFVSFRETFKRHMMDINRPVYPVLDEVMLKLKSQADADVYQAAPIKYIDKVKQRALFLYGKEDKFSIPPKSQKLYDKCGSQDKQLVWFEHGPHSHLRLHNTEQYDAAIVNFVNQS